MKKTILHISDTDEDIVKYLESFQRYLEGHEILCSLDKKNRILKNAKLRYCRQKHFR